jgi:hypothetical protein
VTIHEAFSESLSKIAETHAKSMSLHRYQLHN